MSAQKKNITVLLYGLGAIGGFYAFILSRNSQVTLDVVARSNYDAVVQNGLRIESKNHGNHVVRPRKVLKDLSGTVDKYDFVVCAHKALKLDQTVPDALRPGIGEDTTIVIIQNGVGNEDPFREAFPAKTIISCVTWVGAKQIESGFVRHTESEAAEIGLFPSIGGNPGTDQSRLDEFSGLLRHGQTIFTVEDNVQIKRWEKVVWNAAWNPLTTLTMLDTHSWLNSSPEAMVFTRQLMHEVIQVANRIGVPLEEKLIDTLIDKILAMPGIGSSMQVDAKAGRPLEVDVVLGTPYKRAKELGMDVPALTALYTLTTAVNYRLSHKL